MKAAILLVTLSFSLILHAQSPAPVLFYTDIDSGPAVGGEGGRNGAFVCVYGENFGKSRGSSRLAVGGTEMTGYKLWNDPGEPYTPGYYAKACAQIDARTPLGPQSLQMTTAAGRSNPLAFTVRPGNIYWVTVAGNDKSAGSETKPWATITHCKNKMSAGDICVIGNGVTLNKVDSNNIAVRLDSSGTDLSKDSCGAGYTQPCGPKALVAYPGATVTVDVHKVLQGRPLQTYLPKVTIHDWTIAAISFNGNSFGVQFLGANHIRFADNDVMCQGGMCDGSWNGGGLVTNWANHLWIYGNRFHDIGCHEEKDYAASTQFCARQTAKTAVSSRGTTLTLASVPSSSGSVPGNMVPGDVVVINGQARRTIQGTQHKTPNGYQVQLDSPFKPDIAPGSAATWQWRDWGPSKMYHNVYFSSNSNQVWFAWNSVYGNGRACRGVLFHSSDGKPQYDLHVHDNVIHDTVCDGIDFATVDPSKGTVEAYNNLIYNAGTGPDPIDGPAQYSCIFSAGITHAGTPGSGDILIRNNTLYNCGNNPTGLYPTDRGAIIAVTGSAPGLRMVLTNNIIVQTAMGIPYVSSGSHGAITGANNDCYGGKGGCLEQWRESLNLDPAFINPAAGNFRLSAGSPLKKRGAASAAPEADQDGRTRAKSTALGAY